MEHPVKLFAILVGLNLLFGALLTFFSRYGEARRLGMYEFIFVKWKYSVFLASMQFMFIGAVYWLFILSNIISGVKELLIEKPWARVIFLVLIALIALVLFLLKKTKPWFYGATQASAGLTTCWTAMSAVTHDSSLILSVSLGAGLYLLIEGFENLTTFWTRDHFPERFNKK